MQLFVLALSTAATLASWTSSALAQPAPAPEDIFRDGFDPPGPPPSNDTCQTAISLVLSAPAAGTTTDATNNYDSGLETCTGYSQAGKDVAYSIILFAGQPYTVTLGSPYATLDASISLVGPGTASVCDAVPVTCRAGADTFGFGQGESFSYMPSTTGTYYIIVDSFYAGNGSSGSFTIEVTSP